MKWEERWSVALKGRLRGVKEKKNSIGRLPHLREKKNLIKALRVELHHPTDWIHLQLKVLDYKTHISRPETLETGANRQ
jgi:hypothetical protein